jgi:DNA polymerase III epsilon subunit-like protein
MTTEPRGKQELTYYSVDVEATGPVPGLYNLVSVGATVILPDDSGRLKPADDFYVELRPVFAGHVPEANAVHGLDLERLGREGLEPRTAMERLTAFVESTCRPGSEATFVGHVAVFDWMHVSWYYAWCGLPNPFGYKGLDTKSLGMGVLGLRWPDTSKDVMVPKLGIEPQSEETLHRADADARHQAELLIALLERAGIA